MLRPAFLGRYLLAKIIFGGVAVVVVVLRRAVLEINIEEVGI